MNSISLFTAIPLGAAFLTALLGRKIKGLPDWLGSLSTFSLFGLSIFSLLVVKSAGGQLAILGGWPPPWGICLVLDGLTAFMLVTVNLIAFLVAVYSIGYMERYTAKWKFYALFLLMVAGLNGVIITGDIFNLYVFLEIAAVAAYALVAFGTEESDLEASFKYMVMGLASSAFILLGIALLYGYTSTLNMADISRVLSGRDSIPLLPFIAALFLAGFGMKAALIPFHAWLPDAHPSAPAPISAMLSGVLIKTLGVYAIVRIFFHVLPPDPRLLSVLMVLGVISMVAGVLLAIGQWDFKRLLAYHSISQVGYIILGIGLGTPLGILGGLFHLFNHSVFKSLLFLNSGAVDYALETRDLKKLGGLREKLPTTGNTCLIASMSIAGIPPFNGFWSKLIIVLACVQAGHYIYALWAVLASIVTLASFLKVQRYAFFGAWKDTLKVIRPVPLSMKISMVALSVVCLLGGLLLISSISGDFLDGAVRAVRSSREYAALILGNIP